MTKAPLHIAVIGGGIGGLTAAVALRQAGFEVDVYEQALPARGERLTDRVEDAKNW